jgi:predicted enzyme related to lactoylglutathione lyase
MGAPVVHFEVLGREPEKLRAYYGALFGWEIYVDEAMGYGMTDPGPNAAGRGVAGGIGGCPGDEYPGHVTFYVEVPDVEAALAQAELLGGTRLMGPVRVTEQVEIGQLTDPEGHVVGVIKAQ